MRFLKSEAGMAVPLVLIIMIVLFILGTALWQYGDSELRQAIRAEDSSRAYYVARSGAETMAKYLQSNPHMFQVIEEGGYNITNVVELEGVDFDTAGEMSVMITDIGNDEHEVTGIGISNGVQQTATIVLKLVQFPVNDAVLVTTGSTPINFHQNMTVDGNVITAGEVTMPIDYDGYVIDYGEEIPENGKTNLCVKNYPFPPNYFDRVVVPENPDTKYDDYTIKNNEIFTIANGAHIEFRDLRLDGTLRFHAEEGSITRLVVRDLDVRNKSKIEIAEPASGKVEIYIRRNLILRGDSEYPTAGWLVYYMAEGSSVDVNGNAAIGGLLYGPYDTHVRMQSNSSLIGAFIVETISGQGGENVIGGAQASLEYWIGLGDLEFPEIVNVLYWKPTN